MSVLAQIIKKIRHIRRIIIRNLVVDGQTDCIDCYFTLSKDAHSKPFYTSPIFYDTLNPSWPELPKWPDIMPEISILQHIHIRLFKASKHGIRNNTELDENATVRKLAARLAREAAGGKVTDDDELESKDMLMLEETVNVDELEYVHAASPSTLPNLPPNSLLFVLPDGIYASSKVIAKMAVTKMGHIESFNTFADQGTKNITADSSLDGFRRILALQGETNAAKKETQSVCYEITALVAKLSGRQNKARKAAARAKRRNDLQALCDKETVMLQQQRRGVLELRQRALPRCATLIAQLKQIVHYRDKLRDVKTNMVDVDSPLLRKLLSKVQTRQRRQLYELSSIYTISWRRKQNHKVYLIRDAPLISADLKGPTRDAQDDEKVALALGYICHLVFMLSKILEIPLRYNIMYKGSRSQICDEVLGLSPFPLNQQSGQEKRFDVGRVLLVKNIEQLLNVRFENWPKPRTEIGEVNMLECLQILFNHEIPSLSRNDSGL